MSLTPHELETYLSALVQGQLKIATMIWGPPGVGKSSVVSQIAAAHNLEFVDVRLSQLAPTDLRGLPACVVLLGSSALRLPRPRLRGLPAWAAARAYHVYAMPTIGRKAAVVAGWVTNLISRRDIIGIPQAETPRAAFELAASSGKKK